jgi:hypothetical protein
MRLHSIEQWCKRFVIVVVEIYVKLLVGTCGRQHLVYLERARIIWTCFV